LRRYGQDYRACRHELGGQIISISNNINILKTGWEKSMNTILGSMRTAHKIWLIIVIAAVGLVLLGLDAAVGLNSELLQDRKVATRNLVESAHTHLAFYHQKEKAGLLTREEAQQQALAVTRAIRYGEDGYFWINDMTPKMVMHPTKPALDGKDLSQAADPNGKRLFVAFVDEVRANGAGFVDYMWPKPGHDQPVGKISYVMGFEPWGWVIGSGIYIDDIDSIYWQAVGRMSLIGVVIFMLMSGFSLVVGKAISAPIERLHRLIAEVEQSGDLSRRSGIAQEDELGKIARALDSLMERFQRFVEEAHGVAGRLLSTSADLSRITREMSQDSDRARDQTDQVATAMNEMSSTVQEVARNATDAAQNTQEANKESGNGRQVVDGTISAINSLAEEVESASEVIQQLASNSQGIGQVLDVIRGIAEQTNLLALNAAIEAARAGEQGRGFAVVADEVRTLASRTQESTEEIHQMIEVLQNGARSAVREMEKGRSKAQSSVEQATLAGTSLSRITSAVGRVSEMNTQIATAAEEQSVVAEDINRNVVAIAQMAHKVSVHTGETAEAGDLLRNLAEELETQMAKFKT
jgi:methyl-accepting chemotaxis protein